MIQQLLLLSALFLVKAAQADELNNIAKSGCQPICGDVRIPFPFGIGADCFLDPWYEVECKASPHSNSSSKPLLSKFNVEITYIPLGNSYYSYIAPQALLVRVPPLKMCTKGTGAQRAQLSSIDLRGSPFSFAMGGGNVLAMEGCPGTAFLLDQNRTAHAGCATGCSKNHTGIPGTNSNGLGYCEAPLFSIRSRGGLIHYYLIEVEGQSSSGEDQNCLVAGLKMSSEPPLPVSTSNLSSGAPPVFLVWSWQSNKLYTNYSPDATCRPDRDESFLFCYCNDNHYGNPYILNGCQIPVQCKDCQGKGYCESFVNNTYACVLKPRRSKVNLAVILGINLGLVLLFLVISGCFWIYRFVKRLREMNRRANLFKRNGGLLLQQHFSSSNEGLVERIKLFDTNEVDKATDNFNENRILGQGGQGTVYKGILTDARIVAIKKNRVLNESQLEQFINEVVILSQINHRNVVKVLGCCLETEMPLLVYEFIPNGTLYQHIHEPDEDLVISWEKRLKIAMDSAGAIAYLHSSSSVPIYHRDIKSSNILLDGNHRAKVADFGCSKTIAIDQSHLTTLVQGTLGYLDPEYFQTNQFSDKSDVYSFGVVLLELLTGKKPIFKDKRTMEQKNLVAEFLLLMKKSLLSNILDPEIVKEAKEEELMAVVQLAKRCLSWTGKLRPTMKEVAMTLEMIIKAPGQESTWDQQALPHELFGENVIAEISDTKFRSIQVHVDAVSPAYTDDQRLLPNTV